jgi:autotransporter translocation and assembly factor TamB
LTLASDPQLDQADILSVLLFNKPLSSLEKSEQASLQQNAISITTGFAAAQIGQAVSQALGFQELGVDITNVSVTHNVSGKYGQEVSAEYRITSEWRFSVSASTTGADGADIIWQRRY